MPNYPAPKVAVTPTCTQCGSAVYCGGGAQCPSSSLQVAPDGAGMLQSIYISVPVLQRISMTQTGGQQTLIGKAAG